MNLFIVWEYIMGLMYIISIIYSLHMYTFINKSIW